MIELPKIIISLGGDYGDTGKGIQNFRMIYDILVELRLLGDADYRKRILDDPFGVLENDYALLNVTPVGAGNAGNNIYLLYGRKVPTHLLPPGALFAPFTISLLGLSKKVNLESLYGEVNLAKGFGCEIVPGKNLFIDNYATLTLPQDVELDRAMNAEMRGTRTGSGTSSARRSLRFDPRAADLLRLDAENVKERIGKGVEEYNVLLREHGGREYTIDETMEWLKNWRDKFGTDFVTDGDRLVGLARKNPKAKIFVNGTQGGCLDCETGSIGRTVSYGVYLHDVMKGACLPVDVEGYHVFLTKKDYVTRAGDGFFPEEFIGEQAEYLAKIGGEVGVTSGNIRRTGPNNIAETKFQVRMGAPGFTSLRITKADVYGEFMEKYGPQRAIIGYRRPDGKVVDHLSFPEKVEIIWSKPYQWGKISEADKRRMIKDGFDAFPVGMQERLIMEAIETGTPVSAVSLGAYFQDTVTKGLYEETSKVI